LVTASFSDSALPLPHCASPPKTDSPSPPHAGLHMLFFAAPRPPPLEKVNGFLIFFSLVSRYSFPPEMYLFFSLKNSPPSQRSIFFSEAGRPLWCFSPSEAALSPAIHIPPRGEHRQSPPSPFPLERSRVTSLDPWKIPRSSPLQVAIGPVLLKSPNEFPFSLRLPSPPPLFR